MFLANTKFVKSVFILALALALLPAQAQFVEPPAQAQSAECNNIYVSQLDSQYRAAHKAWVDAMSNLAQGANKDQASALSEKEKDILGKIKYCAHAGNSMAMYLTGNERVRNGEFVEYIRLNLIKKEKIDGIPSFSDIARAAYSEAADWYRKASDKGEANSMYELGMLYTQGRGVSQSSFIAVEWFNRAATTSLNEGYRDFAVRMLEKMTEIAPNHPLTTALTNRIYSIANTAPQDAPKPNASAKKGKK